MCVCNSKFKKAKEFKIDEDLKKISPTSNQYSFTDDFKFLVFYTRKFEEIKTNSDFIIEKAILSNETHIKQFLSIFKINGRYTFHKDLILQLIEKKIKYPDSQIKELSKTISKNIRFNCNRFKTF